MDRAIVGGPRILGRCQLGSWALLGRIQPTLCAPSWALQVGRSVSPVRQTDRLAGKTCNNCRAQPMTPRALQRLLTLLPYWSEQAETPLPRLISCGPLGVLLPLPTSLCLALQQRLPRGRSVAKGPGRQASQGKSTQAGRRQSYSILWLLWDSCCV